MVPMLTCGLVRSNFALPTMVLLRTNQVLRLTTMPDAATSWVLGDLNADTTASLATDLLDDLFCHILGNLGVGVELHRVVGTTLSLGPQVANVSEYLRQRHHGFDDLGAADVLHGVDLATAGVQVANHLAHVVLGRAHLDGHDRLQEHGVGPADGLLPDHGAGDLERHL